MVYSKPTKMWGLLKTLIYYWNGNTHIRACAMDCARTPFRSFSRFAFFIFWISEAQVSLIRRLVACSARTRVDRRTDKRTDRETDRQSFYEDYLIPSSIGFYSSSALYADCNAQAPENCNNSPITIQRGSSSSSAKLGTNISYLMITVMGLYTFG